jgi:hypothetical protein
MKILNKQFVMEQASKPNMSHRKMAIATKVSVKTVISFMKKHDIQLLHPCPQNVTALKVLKTTAQVDPELLISLAKQEGASLTKISQTLNVHHLSVKKQLKDLNLQVPYQIRGKKARAEAREQTAVEALVKLRE